MTLSPEPFVLRCDGHLDAGLDEVWSGAGVFVVYPREGEPYLGRTGVLRRRLKRLLRARETASRLLSLRGIAERVEYWPVASRLESSLLLYALARLHLPGQYLEFLKLRMPHYVRLVAGSGFARTQVTSRLGSDAHYGPFRTRAHAEQFERELLDLFQIRRCQEDFVPAPDHPGCIYGEMGKCLRPCQQVVGAAEYESEVRLVRDFLKTGGAAALHSAEAARDRMSAQLEFEEAARQHERASKIRDMLKLDELATEASTLAGTAILPAVSEGSATVAFMRAGAWLPPVTFDASPGAHTESMDRRLRDIIGSLPEPGVTLRDRQEHVALLARWFYSSWRDGVWIPFEAGRPIPYRRIVAAISRTVHQTASQASH
jgi:excinuclease UvrABC nuclease subunit